MKLRNLCPETQRNYVHHIFGLARFYQTSPQFLSLEEIREYQLYSINERRLSPESVNQFVAAAKFLYNVTLETPWPEGVIPRARVPHRLPVVLSAVEVAEFFQHVCTIRYRAALMTAYGAGLRVSDVVKLQVGDIDSQRMLLRVQQGKGKKDRYCILSPRLLLPKKANLLYCTKSLGWAIDLIGRGIFRQDNHGTSWLSWHRGFSEGRRAPKWHRRRNDRIPVPRACPVFLGDRPARP
jgi:integrase